MYNFKKIFSYLVVAALIAALSISCKSNEEPEVNRLHSNHPPTGTYEGSFTIFDGSSYQSVTATATVTSGDTCNIKGTAYNTTNSIDAKHYDITITKWYDSYGSTNIGSFVLGNLGEATINSPTGTTRFNVNFNNNNQINLGFTLEGKDYSAVNMTRKQ